MNRRISEIAKEHFLLLVGVALFTYNLFDFDYRFTRRLGDVIAYYYNKHTLILLAIGAIFITIGLLKLRNNKGDK